MRRIATLLFATAMISTAADTVKTDAGMLEGTSAGVPGVRVFKGVPYAAPPVGELRWRSPQAVKPWTGVRSAREYGNRCIQTNPYPDMLFQSAAESEDCLYLNVWTPARSASERLPVFFWVHGGGFTSGAGDEKRHNGEAFAKNGVIVVTINYRLGVFGFLAHPELTRESGHKASGNYGMLDQAAALAWVKRNIQAFGGDPNKVTIAGESAGSFAVSALMVMPQARGLFRGAIAESGAFFSREGMGSAQTLQAAEKSGEKLASSMTASTLAALRAKTPKELVQAVTRDRTLQFWPIVDGYSIPGEPYKIFAAGTQSKVPLLAGWTRDEMNGVAGAQPPTKASFAAQLKSAYGSMAARAAEAYPASTDAEALQSAGMLFSDNLIIYPTWKMIELHSKTGGQPVYRYRFDQVLPAGPAVPHPQGAAHATEIEYVFGTLDQKNLPWREEDRKLSATMNAWWSNFVKNGNPNGPGLPQWPAWDSRTRQVMQIEAVPKAIAEPNRNRYEFLDAWQSR